MSTCMSPTRRPFELFISYCSCSCCFFDKHALLCLYTIYYKNTLLCLYAIYYQHTLLCLYQFVKMNTAYKHAIFFLFRFVCNAVSMKHFINGCNYPLHWFPMFHVSGFLLVKVSKFDTVIRFQIFFLK